jgi:uncharacterized membrane protein (DUF106 family)
LSIVVSLIIGVLIGFLTAALMASGRMSDLEDAIYNIKQKINVIFELSTGEENRAIRRMTNEIKQITETFYGENAG